jgi:hypothetical protein
MSVAANTRSQKGKMHQNDEVDTENAPETSQTPQADENIEHDGSSKNARGNSSMVAKAVKGSRFKRHVATRMITRYIVATNKMMMEKQSRTAIQRNLQDIQSKFQEVEALSDHLEKYLEEDEELIQDMYILTCQWT